jgi:hypothetical protein
MKLQILKSKSIILSYFTYIQVYLFVSVDAYVLVSGYSAYMVTKRHILATWKMSLFIKIALKAHYTQV